MSVSRFHLNVKYNPTWDDDFKQQQIKLAEYYSLSLAGYELGAAAFVLRKFFFFCLGVKRILASLRYRMRVARSTTDFVTMCPESMYVCTYKVLRYGFRRLPSQGVLLKDGGKDGSGMEVPDHCHPFQYYQTPCKPPLSNIREDSHEHDFSEFDGIVTFASQPDAC